MKRFFLLVSLVFFCIFSYKSKIEGVFLEKIYLNLKKDEIGITLLSDSDNKGLLISQNDQHVLFLFDYHNFISLKKNLELFGANKIVDVYTTFDRKINIFGKSSQLFQNSLKNTFLKIDRREDLIRMQVKDQYFCIYNDGKNTDFSECDFVYLLNFSKEIDLSDDIQLLFLEENGNADLLKNLYEKWIDSYTVHNQYITVKVLDKKYDISIVPKIGYTN